MALAVFDFNWNLKRKILVDEADKCLRYKDKLLEHVLLHHLSVKTPFTAGGCPLQNTAMEADDTNEALSNRVAKALILWVNDIEDIIANGIKAKEFKPDTDQEGIALHINY